MSTLNFKFELGDEVKDLITGYKGTVLSRCQHVTGCNTYGVQRAHKEGEKLEPAEWFDETRLSSTGKKSTFQKERQDRGAGQNPSVK